MDSKSAGKMSAPVGTTILTGARSISRSTAARWAGAHLDALARQGIGKRGTQLVRLTDGRRERLELAHAKLPRHAEQALLA